MHRLNNTIQKVTNRGPGPISMHCPQRSIDAYPAKAPLSAVDRSEGIVHGSGDYFVSAVEIGAGRYSEQFLKAIDRGLSFKPDERPQSIAEWKKDFEDIDQIDDASFYEEEVPTVEATKKPIIAKDIQPLPKKKKISVPLSIFSLLLIIAAVYYIEIEKNLISDYLATVRGKPVATETDINQIKIDNLLAQAKQSFKSDQLIEPQSNNAYYFYNEVLKLDPANENALSGLDKIFINLFENAKVSMNDGDFESAKKYLAIANDIKPDSEIIRLSNKVLEDKLEDQARLEKEKLKEEQLKQELKLKEEQISKLLDKAEKNIDNEQLISPQGDNARYHYKRILQIDPGNEKAIAGLARISKTYVSRAKEAININDYVLAKEYLGIIGETSPADNVIQEERKTLETKINQHLKQKELENQQAGKISDLLAGAEQDLVALRLSSPAGNNALEKYRNVLKLDPANKTAQSGIINIGNKYMALARSEINKGNYDKAYSQLIIAKKILPDSVAINNTLQELEILKLNREKEEQLALEQQRIEEEKRRLAEEEQLRKKEEQRIKDEEQSNKLAALEAEIKRLEADKAKEEEEKERNKIFSVSVNQIGSKYQALGINPSNLANDIAALLRNYGFKVIQPQETLSGNNGSTMEVIFNPKDDSTGKLVQWDASVSASYLGNIVWSEDRQKKGNPRELYGVTVHIESIDDLRPARDTILKMVENFISKYRNNWPPQ